MRERKEASSTREGQQLDAGASIGLATFDQYRSLLFSIAYRMIGSVADAEDMLQETFIRWQQSREENIESPRAFLVTIISRLCIYRDSDFLFRAPMSPIVLCVCSKIVPLQERFSG